MDGDGVKWCVTKDFTNSYCGVTYSLYDYDFIRKSETERENGGWFISIYVKLHGIQTVI